MGLHGRLNFIPRIYCLSLPGTPRQKEMKSRLNNLGFQWEFVYGDNLPPDDEIKWDEVRNSEWMHWYDKNLVTDYPAGLAGCKRGTRRALQKGLDDGAVGFLFCNDDIVPIPEEMVKIPELIRQLPQDVGMLGLCYSINPIYLFDAGPPFFECKGRYRMEWLCYITRWFAARYVEALDTEGCESDASIERYVMKHPENKVYVVKRQTASRSHAADTSIIDYSISPTTGQLEQ